MKNSNTCAQEGDMNTSRLTQLLHAKKEVLNTRNQTGKNKDSKETTTSITITYKNNQRT